MEGWPEAREINTEGWELQEATAGGGETWGLWRKEVGVARPFLNRDVGGGPWTPHSGVCKGTLSYPRQMEWELGVSLPGSAPEPRREDAVVQKVPGLGRSCPAGRRGRAGRCPSV